MPSLCPPRHLLGITSRWWGSRPRPGTPAFRIPWRQLYSTKRRKGEFPYRDIYGPLERKELLRRLSFPRVYPSFWSKIRWTAMHIPQLLKALIHHAVQYPFWLGLRYPDDPRIVKSRIGYAVRNLILQSDETIQPWGNFSKVIGSSMRPALGSNPSIVYMSYAYTQREDIRLGDIVFVLHREYNEDKTWWCKRVVAFGPSRVQLFSSGTVMPQIVKVPSGQCFVVGDNYSVSRDSRQCGSLLIEAVYAKVIWQCGPDGFRWMIHEQSKTNSATKTLAPGENPPMKPLSPLGIKSKIPRPKR